MCFWKLKLKEPYLPYFAEAFKNDIYQYDDKSFELMHFLKNRFL